MFSWSNILIQKLSSEQLHKLIFGLKIYFGNWKCQIIDNSASSFLIGYHKILWGGSLGCKKILKFACLTRKFHNHCHTNVDIRKVFHFTAAALNNFSKNLCNKFLGFIAKVLDIPHPGSLLPKQSRCKTMYIN